MQSEVEGGLGVAPRLPKPLAGRRCPALEGQGGGERVRGALDGWSLRGFLDSGALPWLEGVELGSGRGWTGQKLRSPYRDAV